MDNMDVKRFLEKTENEKIPLFPLNDYKMNENNVPINVSDDHFDDEFDVIRSIN